MNARRFTFVLVWLALTQEIDGEIFDTRWSTPLTAFDTAIFRPLPGIKAPIWDIVVVALLAFVSMTSRAKPGDRARPMITSMKVALAAIATWWMWGVVRGGSIRQTMWQLHPFVIGLVLAFLIAATCRTTAHLASLGKVVVFAALYRAAVLMIFYFTIARGLDPPLQTLTTHADTVLFVSAMLVMIANALERRTLRAISWMVITCIPLALAIKWNNRRLAWLSLFVGVALSYVVIPRTRFKRRMNVALLALLPVLVAYVVVGWGRTSNIFKPVGAISTMFGTHADTSSEMRDIENYNLVYTLKSDPLLGTGWGHPYEEVSVAISIKDVFAQYRYIPHNSVLGLVAFTGVLGFALTWQVFVVAIFFLAISIRAGPKPMIRIASIASLGAIVTFLLQMWGDMGWNTLPCDVILAAGIAVAVRVPVLSGAWSKMRSDKKQRDPYDREDREDDDGLPEPAPGATLAREHERDRDGREENPDEDDFLHGRSVTRPRRRRRDEA